MGHKLRAIQPQALHEELTFSGHTGDMTIVAHAKVLRQIVVPWMKQPYVGRVLFVPVSALMLVAARARVDEVLCLARSTTRAGSMVIHRQRGADILLVDAAVSAASVEPLPDLRAQLIGHGIDPFSGPGWDRAP